MNLTIYNSLRKIIPTSPHDYYKQQQQALINAFWNNTTTLSTVQEQIEIDSWAFDNIDIHLNHVVEEGSTGLKNGDDFRELVFQDLDHEVVRGLYYKFADNYWLSTYTDEAHRITKDVIVRRCNNKLKWRNQSGTIYEYPCIIDYELSGGKPSNTDDIVTPTNSITVITQGNIDTRAIDVNQRFIFNNRAYKVGGYNNYLQNDINNDYTHILYFSMQLDEISPYDNLATQLANAIEPSDTVTPTPLVIIYPAIVVTPLVNELKQSKSIIFTANAYQNSTTMLPDVVTCTPSGANMINYQLESLGSNQYKLTNIHKDINPLVLTFSNGVLSTIINIQLLALI